MADDGLVLTEVVRSIVHDLARRTIVHTLQMALSVLLLLSVDATDPVVHSELSLPIILNLNEFLLDAGLGLL